MWSWQAKVGRLTGGSAVMKALGFEPTTRGGANVLVFNADASSPGTHAVSCEPTACHTLTPTFRPVVRKHEADR